MIQIPNADNCQCICWISSPWRRRSQTMPTLQAYVDREGFYLKELFQNKFSILV